MNAPAKIKPQTLIEALALALPELGGAKKNAANPHFKSKYADLGAVIEAIRPVAEHGVWFIQETHENAHGAEVETFYIGHGEKLSAGRLFVPADKNNAHGFGSALTYARRYSLQCAFGLPSEDDDGNAAASTPPKKSALVDDAQWSELTQLIAATQTDAEKFCTAYKIESVKELPAADFERARKQLNAKLSKMVEAESGTTN